MANSPDPNPIALSLPWGDDLQLNNNGGLAYVRGVEKIRQRIIRRYFTAAEHRLADGEYVPADYIFAPDYGLGASRLVGEPISDQLAAVMTQKIRQAVLVDEGVDTTQNPEIKLFASGGTVWAKVKVFLLDGSPETLNFPAQ